jgi:hypothetical protein
MRLAVFACLGTLALASSAAASADPVTATMTTSSTTPIVGEPWRYSITVQDRAGRPVAGKVRLQVLLGARVVGCWKSTALRSCSGAGAGTWIPFKGKRAATIVWPRLPNAGKLTFRAIVVAGTRTLRLRAPVTVQTTP